MGERHTEEMRLLGLTIAFYRRARGLTQSELAEAVQISRTHMSNIEAPNSHTSLSLNKLMDIAEALEISNGKPGKLSVFYSRFLQQPPAAGVRPVRGAFSLLFSRKIRSSVKIIRGHLVYIVVQPVRVQIVRM